MDFKVKALSMMFKYGKVRRGAKLKPRREILQEIGVFQHKDKRLSELHGKLLEYGYIYFDISYHSNISTLEYKHLLNMAKNGLFA